MLYGAWFALLLAAEDIHYMRPKRGVHLQALPLRCISAKQAAAHSHQQAPQQA
jgi:hypothetical protein